MVRYNSTPASLNDHHGKVYKWQKRLGSTVEKELSYPWGGNADLYGHYRQQYKVVLKKTKN